MEMEMETPMNDERTSRVFTLPNILSFTRILLTPFFIWAMVNLKPWHAFGIFLLAGVTDALDGFTARFFRLKSNIGLWLDPMGDKVLLTAAFVCLTLTRLSVPNVLPLWLTATCVGRDVLIAVGALVYFWLRGRTQFPPSLLGKASTILQVMTLLGVLLWNGLGTSPEFLSWLYGLTAAVTVASGVLYVISAVRRFVASSPAKAAS
jgi:cardiolipin synthase